MERALVGKSKVAPGGVGVSTMIDLRREVRPDLERSSNDTSFGV